MKTHYLKSIIILSLTAFIITGCTKSCSEKKESPAVKEDKPDYTGISVPHVVKLNGKEGTGKAIDDKSEIKMRYGSWVYDQRKLANKGKPITENSTTVISFRIGDGQMIKGIDEGVLGMKKGGTRTLIIPPDAAYGKEGLPPNVEPGNIILVELEILEVK